MHVFTLGRKVPRNVAIKKVNINTSSFSKTKIAKFNFLIKIVKSQKFLITKLTRFMVYTTWKEKIISHKKRSVIYNEVCNNKVFDCHHSEYVLYMCVKKKYENKTLSEYFDTVV